MAVRESDRAREVDRIVELPPIEPARRNGRTLAIIVVAMFVGVAAGWTIYQAVANRARDERIAAAQQIQRERSEALVEHFERRWSAEALGATGSGWRIRVTGTGPGLVHVADRQRSFAERGVTGTGPGLVTVATIQTTAGSGPEPTGTLGIERLPSGPGPETAMVGIP